MLKSLILSLGIVLFATPVWADLGAATEQPDNKSEADASEFCPLCKAKAMYQGKWTDLSPEQQLRLIDQAATMVAKDRKSGGEKGDSGAVKDGQRKDRGTRGNEGK